MKGNIVGSRYKILEYLAEGGFGRTYLAEDTQLPGKDICVVKQLYPSSQDEKFLAIARRLFKTEASTLHNLGDHPQIPQLLAYFEEAEKFYLVQQYIEGETLAQELSADSIWSEDKAIEFLQDGLSILKFVHEQRVIHRDVKPDNLIRRSSDGKLVLVDFGTVKQVLQGQKTNVGQLTVPVGTQGYMPTEQARGKPRPTSDLYALGIIAIQAVTGIPPLDLPEDDDGEMVWESCANVSQELATILTRMTRYHFKDRYKSAEEALEDLYKLLTVKATAKRSLKAFDTTTFDPPQDETTIINSPEAKTSDREDPVSHVDRQNLQGQPTKMQYSSAVDVDSNQGEYIDFREIVPQPGQTNKRSNSNHKFNRKIIGIVLMVAIVAILGGVGSFFLQSSNSDSEINSPEDLPTRKIDQGEGFRPEFQSK